MSAAHFHLIINHLPIFTIPLTLIFYVHGFLNQNERSKNFALKVLFFSTLFIIPTYFSGENSEDLIETISGINKEQIEEHEEIAKIALIIGILSAITSGASVFLKKFKFKAQAEKAAIFLSFISLILLILTAQQGGKIRHPEIDQSETSTSEKNAPEDSMEVFIEDENE